ncbi:MAG: hypothetical protein KDC92_13380 [Bacteroidetes bacterium]|nr:hypothetical protein [Bacteroidota bacterium]
MSKSRKIMPFLRWLYLTLLLCFVFAWFGYRTEVKRKKGTELNAIESLASKINQYGLQVEDLFSGRLEKLENPLWVNGPISDNAQTINKAIEGEKGYLLFSGFNDNQELCVWLKALNSGKIIHSWHLDNKWFLQTKKDAFAKFKTDYENGFAAIDLSKEWYAKTEKALQILHPLMLRDSSLIFSTGDNSTLFCINKKSELVWQCAATCHHSIEIDYQGNIWACSINTNSEESKKYGFQDDGLKKINPKTGAILFDRPLSEILRTNGLLRKFTYRHPSARTIAHLDPYHLNDIEPILNNGAFWKKGDLLLSCRNISTIFLYRPENDSILWYKTGPWLCQHDVDVIDSCSISVFNNNVLFSQTRKRLQYHGQNQMDYLNSDSAFNSITIYNLKTDSTYNYHLSAFKENGLFTQIQGRCQIQPDGSSFVEINNMGLLCKVDSDGKLAWKTFIPYIGNYKKMQLPTWTRYLRLENGRFVE